MYTLTYALAYLLMTAGVLCAVAALSVMVLWVLAELVMWPDGIDGEWSSTDDGW